MVGVFCSESFSSLQPLLDTGRFAKALQKLETDGRPAYDLLGIEWDLLSAELALETGATDFAAVSAKRVLSNRKTSAYFRARAHRVLSNTSFYSGDINSCQTYLAKAKGCCEAGDTSLIPLIAHLELLGFSLASRLQPIDSALSLLTGVRRLVTRSRTSTSPRAPENCSRTSRGATPVRDRSEAPPYRCLGIDFGTSQRLARGFGAH